MSARVFGTIALAVCLFAGPAGARAQAAGEMDHGDERTVSAGGEITGVLSRIDNDSFFNYTDYHRNALRLGRIRLFGEWHPIADRVSIIGELRSENGTRIESPALYLRWRPAARHDLFIQVGRIPPVIGAFPRRAYGRDNAVLGLPLAYQYLTSLRPDALPVTNDDLIRMRGRGWQPSFPLGSQALEPGISLVSVSRWDTGAEASWSNDHLDLAGAVTQGAPAVPVLRDHNGGLMWSGRAAAHLPSGVTLGLSGARGQWINDSVLALTTNGLASASSQSVVGADFEWGLGAWLIRSEWIRSVFQVPVVNATDPDGRLSAWSTFVEARYQLLPRWQIGTRVERLAFSDITGTLRGGAPTPWDAPVNRAEATLGFRASRQIELRVGWQEDWRSAGRVPTQGIPALAALYWF